MMLYHCLKHNRMRKVHFELLCLSLLLSLLLSLDDLSIECLETCAPEQELESESETTPDDEKVDKQHKGPLPRFISRNKEVIL